MGVIPVLARQLALWGDRRLRVEIACAVDEDRDIAQRTLEVQFKKLIQRPLETLADDPDCPPIVVLLDGLDECNNDYVSRLLHLIGQSFATLPAAVRFIITSRPEPHLCHHYASEPLYGRLYIRSLDSEEVGEMEKDIEAFFRRELPRMVLGMVKKPLNWPGEKRLQILVRMSDGLWIWAVTVARMLADQKFRGPEKQLDTLISPVSNTHKEYGHNTDPYSLYSMILNRACPSDSHSELLTLFRDVLGALCLSTAPINTYTLASLICSDHSKSDEFTDGDYLTDVSRCDTRFLVNVAAEHRRMAIRCLHRMDDLQKPNICDIDPTILHSTFTSTDNWEYRPRSVIKPEVKDLAKRHISSALQYACENWATHVSRSPPEHNDVYVSIDMFVRTRLLYWVEVLSLLGMTENVIKLVTLVEVWLEKAGSQRSSELPTPTLPRRIVTFLTEDLVKMYAGLQLHANVVHTPPGSLSLWALGRAGRFFVDFLSIQHHHVSFQASTLLKESDISTLSLLQDVKNFIAEFGAPISASPPHIYLSALPFTPSHTSLSRVYGHLAEGGPKPRRGCLQQWSQWGVRCLAWSSDGQRIISGSPHGTLCLWDPSTGARIGGTWKHTHGVECVAWSPDGRMIVAGSYVCIHLWDSTTGITKAWKGREHVRSLAWSPDGKWVVSGSDKTLSIWDLATGTTVAEA
ncbi:hypothetical protein FRB95_010345 [Tulasnella sp. JGI-2019a]|nr:hypothetical protein FRB95_010345 [Tulasnella sp. JGI-2019a]